MNYLINTGLSVAQMITNAIRSLFVLLAKADIQDMNAELRSIPKAAQRALLDAEREHAKRIKEIKSVAFEREQELHFRIERIRRWIDTK